MLAHNTCNAAKSDHLAARQHLESWMERNRSGAAYLGEQFNQKQIIHSVESAESIARWAYVQAAAAGAWSWVKGREFQPLDASFVWLQG